MAASSSGAVKFQWKKNWYLKIPPKIQTFLWRACLDILPTRAELFRRKIVDDPSCRRCGAAYESFLHIITKCGGSHFIWQQFPFADLSSIPTSSTGRWTECMLSTLAGEAGCLATIVMWKLWDNWNREMHGEEGIRNEDVVSWCQSYLVQVSQGSMEKMMLRTIQHPYHWKPPNEGVVKINVDVTFPSGAEYYSVAYVARNNQGECLWWGIYKIHGRPKPVDGEAYAVLFALRKAQLASLERVIIEGDNLQVITALRNKNTSLASFGAFIESCLLIARDFTLCSFEFIKRSGNSLAHTIAKNHGHACKEGVILPMDLANVV